MVSRELSLVARSCYTGERSIGSLPGLALLHTLATGIVTTSHSIQVSAT